MKQKDSTIHWKNLDKKKNDKKIKKNTKSSKNQNGKLFKASDDEVEGNTAEQNPEENNKNAIYKGDGEMPEGALSSSEENEVFLMEIWYSWLYILPFISFSFHKKVHMRQSEYWTILVISIIL